MASLVGKIHYPRVLIAVVHDAIRVWSMQIVRVETVKLCEPERTKINSWGSQDYYETFEIQSPVYALEQLFSLFRPSPSSVLLHTTSPQTFVVVALPLPFPRASPTPISRQREQLEQ